MGNFFSEVNCIKKNPANQVIFHHPLTCRHPNKLFPIPTDLRTTFSLLTVLYFLYPPSSLEPGKSPKVANKKHADKLNISAAAAGIDFGP